MKFRKSAILLLTTAVGLTVVGAIFAANHNFTDTEMTVTDNNAENGITSDLINVTSNNTESEEIIQDGITSDLINVTSDNTEFEEIITIQDGITDDLSSKNYLVIDNEDIYNSDKIWNQPAGHTNYRVYVTNEQNEEMRMTLRYGESIMQYIIPGNDSKTFVVSNAQAVEHKLSFSTDSGAVKGKINVKVLGTEL